MQCETCQLLSNNLDGWTTQFCPVCQKIGHEGTKQPKQQPKAVQAVKKPSGNAFQNLMKQVSVLKKPCICKHAGSDPCQGDYWNCKECSEKCVPF